MRKTAAALVAALVAVGPLGSVTATTDFARVDALTLEPGEVDLASAVIDPEGAFAYFGARTVPGRIVKIDVATFTRVGALTLEPGDDLPRSAVIDPAGTFAYFGTGPFTPPARVVKIRISQVELEVPVDAKPQSCPNPMNVRGRGVLPAAILGTPTFDVTQVDPTSVRLEGVEPIRWALEDVATPFEPFTGRTEATDCTEEGPDGFLDLTLKFDVTEVVAALNEAEDGNVLVLTLTGALQGSTPIVGEDVVVILNKGK